MMPLIKATMVDIKTNDAMQDKSFKTSFFFLTVFAIKSHQNLAVAELIFLQIL
jgi:hypothetical protein